MLDILSQPVISQISTSIAKHNYKKVVLQLDKCHMPQSFQLTLKLRQFSSPDVQYYTLYDSMKKPCCTDIIGARHVNYDVLYHFGYACFSEKYSDHHQYVLPQSQALWGDLQDILNDKQIQGMIKQSKISLVLCDQSVYGRVMKLAHVLAQMQVEVARLPFDSKEDDVYLGFSYYCRERVKDRNILVIKLDAKQEIPTQTQPEQGYVNPTSDLIVQNICLCKKSLGIDRIYTLTPGQGLVQYTRNQNKRLMQRISQISQLQKYTTFGILVSNPSTKFCHAQINHCRKLLDSRGLKHFAFMMNNLNECKLGNFPQIEVYVVVACYNYSLYTSKDFYRLVVTPYDLQVAFGSGSYELYQFDLSAESVVAGLKHQQSIQKQIQNSEKQQVKKQGKKEHQQQQIQQLSDKMIQVQIVDEQKQQQQNRLAKMNRQLMIANSIQTLDYYKSREYKGLDFSEKKDVEKVKLGKIGIATGYQPLKQHAAVQNKGENKGEKQKVQQKQSKQKQHKKQEENKQ